MFCDNISYQTQRNQKGFQNYCSPNNISKQVLSYNYLPTQKSQRNPSNLYQHDKRLPNHQIPQRYELPIGQNNNTLQLMNQNTRRQYKLLKTVQRNKNIASILTIILAFSQRIQVLKQKLCGYPAQTFSPLQFFNVLDLTQKGSVDIYDFKRFINNPKIQQKDIIALFKKINGDHSKDNTKLTYFGYLNLIKPYFNQSLAKDLLMRDTLISKKSRKTSNHQQKINTQFLQATQQSVLLLFQQLMLLHSICTCQHQQAKQMLINEYMLNINQIKQILGLNYEAIQQKRIKSNNSRNSSSPQKHKTPLTLLFQFIQNNSEFQIQFQQMKYLLSFLNAHQFSLNNDKYLSVLFLPINCKRQILNELSRRKQAQNLHTIQDTARYMNAYLTKQNLMNRGNLKTIKQYLEQKEYNNLANQHLKVMNNNIIKSKVNFLEFVHPQSLKRVQNNPQLQHQILINEHPQLLINPSNKYVYQNKKGAQIQISGRQMTNNSSIPQQNVKVYLPQQASNKINASVHHHHLRGSNHQNRHLNYGLNGQFYQQNQANISSISRTPFLQQFMKESNVAKNVNKHRQINPKINIYNRNESQIIDASKISESAFQIIDYGYEPKNTKQSNNLHQLKREKLQNSNNKNLDTRYNLVVSQYRDNAFQKSTNNVVKGQQNKNLFNIIQNQSYSKGIQQKRGGPKFEHSNRNNKVDESKYGYLAVDNSRNRNYINSIGMSQSNMMNQSNVNRNNSYGLNVSGVPNILDDFMRR